MKIRLIVLLLIIAKPVISMAQTQHINQLTDSVLYDFIVNYRKKHNIDNVLLENKLTYGVGGLSKIKKRKYKKGKKCGGLKDRYYLCTPTLFLMAKDTLRIQYFLTSTDMKSGFLEIYDTCILFFVYDGDSGRWEYDRRARAHATHLRDGKFVGDFVRECMEECLAELQPRVSSRNKVYVVDDYLTFFSIEGEILPYLPHIPLGNVKRNYCMKNDWLIGFPEIVFHHDTIAVNAKVVKMKDYKDDKTIGKYLQCTLYYAYNSDTRSWNLCRKEDIDGNHVNFGSVFSSSSLPRRRIDW